MAVRVFLAGATGVLGVRLVPLLVKAGHVVAGMTRSPAKIELLDRLGAVPVLCDALDRQALIAAVGDFAPEAVIHQLTDLPDDPALMRASIEANARIRREGTANMIAAVHQSGASKLIVQSIAWNAGGSSIEFLETATLDAGGIVLRYGRWYGPGTYHPTVPPEGPRVHVDTAARRTVEALDLPSGIYTIVDQ